MAEKPKRNPWATRAGWASLALTIVGLLWFASHLMWWTGDVAGRRGVVGQAAREACQGQEGCEHNDLAAQIRVADASDTLVTQSFWQIGLGVLTAFGLALTVVYSRKAWGEAERQADSALRAVMVAESTARHQLRAYILCSRLIMTNFEVGKIPQVYFCPLNVGQTPAKGVRTLFAWRITANPDTFRPTFANFKPRSRMDIGPQQHIEVPAFVGGRPLSVEEYVEFMEGRMGVVAFGYVSYRDIFGRLRRTIFRGTAHRHTYRRDEESGAEMWGFLSSEKHNRFT